MTAKDTLYSLASYKLLIVQLTQPMDLNWKHHWLFQLLLILYKVISCFIPTFSCLVASLNKRLQKNQLFIFQLLSEGKMAASNALKSPLRSFFPLSNPTNQSKIRNSRPDHIVFKCFFLFHIDNPTIQRDQLASGFVFLWLHQEKMAQHNTIISQSCG